MASTSRTSFFQTRSAAAAPLVTRTALPVTPRPIVNTQQRPTAIVLAWDNVLFPTKWMVDSFGLKSMNKKSLEDVKHMCVNNPFTVEGLQATEQQVFELLSIATTMAPVFILSDHNTAAIDALCSTFYPRIKSYLANASDRLHVMSLPEELTLGERADWKANVLQQICSASMVQQRVQSSVRGAAQLKVLAVSADQVDLHAAARVQEQVARVGSIRTMALQSAKDNGKPLSLLDFHKQLRVVAAALANQN